MNKLQQVDLEILKDFLKVCNCHKLNYYVIGGTLLGAIRHKGFIPWDDDIDIGMPRVDYEKFLKIAPSLLKSNLQIVNYKTDKNYQYYITRIRDKTTKVVEKRIGNNSKFTYASIDLFPLDGAPNNSFLRKFYYFKIMCYRALMSMCYKDSIDNDRVRGSLERVLLFFLKKIPFDMFFCPNKIKYKIDSFMKKYKFEDSNFIGCLMGAYRTNEMIQKNIYGNGKNYSFENILLQGPEHYHDFLTHLYGDYMQLPPLEARKTHFELL